MNQSFFVKQKGSLSGIFVVSVNPPFIQSELDIINGFRYTAGVGIIQPISQETLMPIEHEAKFILTDADAVRARIIALKGQTEGRFFETNIRYENDNESLKTSGILLRLRKDRKVWLTYKSPSSVIDSGVKSMNEMEVSVSDFDTMNDILEGVGFHRAQIYEKWRETYELNAAKLCLDTMPFGEFLEIEGTPEDVRELSSTLALPWESRVLDNYLTIFARLKQWEHYPFNDLTFDNFKDHEEDLKKYTHLLEVGC